LIPASKDKKVLIVEDALLMYMVIKGLLDLTPYLKVVGHARNGREALDVLDTLSPDLILLDLEMPEMNGLEFLRHARLKSRAKIVVLSSIATAGSPEAREAKRLGAHAVISKPSGSISMDLREARGTVLLDTVYGLLNLK
jgi:chemotaxis response regulator CheB